MIKPQQKTIPHIYARAAALEDATYRAILREECGVLSLADCRVTQAGWERLMASLEAVLFERVASGRVPSPIGRIRYISRPRYWRDRLPAPGRISSRQAKLIEDCWLALLPSLAPAQRSRDYLSGIIRQATGRTSVGESALTSHEAAQVLDALKSKLAEVTP